MDEFLEFLGIKDALKKEEYSREISEAKFEYEINMLNDDEYAEKLKEINDKYNK